MARYGADHVQTAIARFYFACAVRANGEVDRAVEEMERTRTVFLKVAGSARVKICDSGYRISRILAAPVVAISVRKKL